MLYNVFYNFKGMSLIYDQKGVARINLYNNINYIILEGFRIYISYIVEHIIYIKFNSK